jgi:hypothetical protein
VTFWEFFEKSITSVFLVLVDSVAAVNSPDRVFGFAGILSTYRGDQLKLDHGTLKSGQACVHSSVGTSLDGSFVGIRHSMENIKPLILMAYFS